MVEVNESKGIRQHHMECANQSIFRFLGPQSYKFGPA